MALPLSWLVGKGVTLVAASKSSASHMPEQIVDPWAGASNAALQPTRRASAPPDQNGASAGQRHQQSNNDDDHGDHAHRGTEPEEARHVAQFDLALAWRHTDP